MDFIRRGFANRWPVPARVVLFCRFGGALTALISVGVPLIWLLLFPLTMAGALRLMQQWRWLPPIPDAEQRRKSSRALLAASFSVVLAFLALPFLALLIIVFGVLPAVLLLLYVRMTGTRMLPRQQENLSTEIAVVLIVIYWALLYCGLQANALRRFTRQWHRPLFFGIVACTCIPLPVAMFVAEKVSWSHNTVIPLQPLGPIVEQWIFAIVLVSQMGALFGKWLASPPPNQTVENITICP